MEETVERTDVKDLAGLVPTENIATAVNVEANNAPGCYQPQASRTMGGAPITRGARGAAEWVCQKR